MRATAAAERAGALCSAAALCGWVTGDGEMVLRGIDSTRVWVREVARDMANSTVYIGWGIGVSQGLATARGGEGSPAICVRAVLDLIRVRFSC